MSTQGMTLLGSSLVAVARIYFAQAAMQETISVAYGRVVEQHRSL